MSRTDAYILISCDECGEEEECSLCALAGGGWDERYIEDKVKRWGWTSEDGRDYCQSCSEERSDRA